MKKFLSTATVTAGITVGFVLALTTVAASARAATIQIPGGEINLLPGFTVVSGQGIDTAVGEISRPGLTISYDIGSWAVFDTITFKESSPGATWTETASNGRRLQIAETKGEISATFPQAEATFSARDVDEQGRIDFFSIVKSYQWHRQQEGVVTEVHFQPKVYTKTIDLNQSTITPAKAFGLEVSHSLPEPFRMFQGLDVEPILSSADGSIRGEGSLTLDNSISLRDYPVVKPDTPISLCWSVAVKTTKTASGNPKRELILSDGLHTTWTFSPVAVGEYSLAFRLYNTLRIPISPGLEAGRTGSIPLWTGDVTTNCVKFKIITTVPNDTTKHLPGKH